MTNIKIIKNGPAIISSGDYLITIDGKMPEILTNMVAICRCGKSSNGIYCDGSHSKKYDEGGYEIKD